MIFYKNPLRGQVKTRLAATIGDDRALEIYRRMALHIRDITQGLAVDKIVWYSDSIVDDDLWPATIYRKSVQRGNDLGERMLNSFEDGFASGTRPLVIIGTDCYELSSSHLEQAFDALQENDVVIGPARDGGYYLLGMNRLHPALFKNKKWSTSSVFGNTLNDINTLGLTCATLPVLRDVDREEDLPDALLK